MRDRSGQIEDELLVLRSQDGEAVAFDQLVMRWQDRLWRHARRLIGDDDSAWDAVQESWMGMLKDLRRLDDPGAFAAWAYRIVTFKCVDHMRRMKRLERTEETQAGNEAGTVQEEDGAVEELRSALLDLTVEQRAVLSLHYREELGIDRIAEILGVPAGTVKSRLHHAREALRRKMERRGR